MSSDFRKRRCIIKKLDFENCIVTNIKTKARGKKKLRARITQEIEDYSDPPEDVRPCGEPLDESFVTSQQKNLQIQTSPVLTANVSSGRESPVFLRRKKSGASLKGEKATERGAIDETPSPSSPVFKFLKKSKILNESFNRSQESEQTFEKTASFINYPPEEESSKSEVESSYQIDDATTQESKDSIKISSVESPSFKNQSFSSFSAASSSVALRNSSGEFTSSNYLVEKCDSPKLTRRNYKKNSLLSRLHKLQQKQASEKLLWQHQNRRNSSSSLKFTVVTLWKEEFNFFLKCKSVSEDLSITFLVIDSRWVPNLKKVKEASVLLVHPPWQKLIIKEFNMTVLINVICLDILDEEKESTAEERKFEMIPGDQFETHEKLFIDSLFWSNAYGFIC